MNRLVCLCKKIRKRDIIDVIKDGCYKLELIQNKTGAATRCGKCIPSIDALLEEHKKSSLIN